MAIVPGSLKDSIINNLILGGYGKDIVTPMVDDIIANGVSMFWRERPWSFSFKTDTFSLTAGTATYTCPNDCDGIVRLKREGTTGSADMIELPSHVFDADFPYPGGQANGDALFYKVEMDNGAMKITTMPVSNATVTVRRTYKIKYSLQTALPLIPEDFRSVVLSACLFHSMPAGKGDRFAARGAAQMEYDALLKKAFNLDKVSYRKLSQVQGQYKDLINPNSWQFFLKGYDLD